MRQSKAPCPLRGIVVRLQNYRDADRIFELLTAERGRVDILARGARASKRRFAGAIDLFTSLKVEIRQGRGLNTLQSVEIQDVRLGIRSRLENIERAATLVECARSIVPHEGEASACFAALESGLDKLAAGHHVDAIMAFPALIRGAGLSHESPAHPTGLGHRVFAPEEMKRIRRVLGTGCCDDEAHAHMVQSYICSIVEDHIGKPLKSIA